MEVAYSLVCYSHDPTTAFFTLFSIFSHLSITYQTDSLTTVITLTLVSVTIYLKLKKIIAFIYAFNPQEICKVRNVKQY
jgi:hypothetical protein